MTGGNSAPDAGGGATALPPAPKRCAKTGFEGSTVWGAGLAPGKVGTRSASRDSASSARLP